jgi:hypothetical protein
MDDLFLALMFVSLICFFLSWIIPNSFAPLFQNKLSNGKIRLVFGLAIIAFLILFGISSDSKTSKTTNEDVATSQEKAESKTGNTQSNPILQEESKEKIVAEDKQAQVQSEKVQAPQQTAIKQSENISAYKKAMSGIITNTGKGINYFQNATVYGASENYADALREIEKASNIYSTSLAELNKLNTPESYKKTQELFVDSIDKFSQANSFLKNALSKQDIDSAKRASTLMNEGIEILAKSKQELDIANAINN